MFNGGTGQIVFSAHAEVVPRNLQKHHSPQRILRARGGSSVEEPELIVDEMYSPRTRR